MSKSTDDRHDAESREPIIVGKIGRPLESTAPTYLSPSVEAAIVSEAMRTTDGPVEGRVAAAARAVAAYQAARMEALG